MRALVISADGFEDSELQFPLESLSAAGVAADVASTARGAIRGKHGQVVAVDLAVAEVDPAAYDLLVLPGGKAPARLRKDPAVLGLVRTFVAAGKPVAAICHGPQILGSAGVLAGRVATCYRSVAGELRAAGARYLDERVVVDGNLITARKPADLPYFVHAVLAALGLSPGA